MSWAYKALAAILGALGLGAAALFFRRRALSKAAKLRVSTVLQSHRITEEKRRELQKRQENTYAAEEVLRKQADRLKVEVVKQHRKIDGMTLEEIKNEFIRYGY